MFDIPHIEKLDQTFVNSAEDKLAKLAIPKGALGELGDLAVKLMTFSQSFTPSFTNRELFLCAADHGVAMNKVSQYPQISDKILSCASHRGAVINALCETHNCQLSLMDCGLINEPKSGSVKIHDHVISRGGTKDFSLAAAMSPEQCKEALENGVSMARNSSAQLILLGEMGIGNTSSAAAMFAKNCNLSIEECVGAGTGLDSEGIKHKTKVIQQSLDRFSIEHLNPAESAFEIIRQVGGFELATLVGICLGAAEQGKLILLDGFLSAVVAIMAKSFNPNVLDYMIASHLSQEQAHKKALEILDKSALLDLQMRLGEGSGAVLALPLIDSVCAILSQCMSLDEALNV